MLGLYLACLMFGGLLIGVSLVFGGGDHDLDHDGDLELDLDGDHDADADPGGGEIWLPLLSMRFWTFAAAAFGLTGTLLTLFGIGWWAALLASMSTALGLGLGAAYLFEVLRRETVSADMGLARLVGNEARVLLTIRPDDTGKICIDTMAGRIELLARSRDGVPIAHGTTVLIANIEDGVADVTSLPTAPRAVTDRRTTTN